MLGNVGVSRFRLQDFASSFLCENRLSTHMDWRTMRPILIVVVLFLVCLWWTDRERFSLNVIASIFAGHHEFAVSGLRLPAGGLLPTTKPQRRMPARALSLALAAASLEPDRADCEPPRPAVAMVEQRT
jgi:hypothetical protein